MKRWSWLVILAIGALSLGTAYAESRACCPPPCDDPACCASICPN
ncbi:MAG TPA: hypothetical protein VKG01_13475 [Thermoanaerobaculia bacterium]|nr:hypothetical protein [Thermoanaerobaculia bacterium]